jgi:hypothetical protein
MVCLTPSGVKIGQSGLGVTIGDAIPNQILIGIRIDGSPIFDLIVKSLKKTSFENGMSHE